MQKNKAITLHPNIIFSTISIAAGIVILISGAAWYFASYPDNHYVGMIVNYLYIIVFAYFTALRAPIFFSRIKLYEEKICEKGIFAIRAKILYYSIEDFGVGYCQNPKMYKKWIYVSTSKLTDEQKQHMEYLNNSDDFIRLRYSEKYYKLIFEHMENCGVKL